MTFVFPKLDEIEPISNSFFLVRYLFENRYQTVCIALIGVDGSDGIEYAKDILNGKYGFICQYDKPLNFGTIWSSVFDISNNRKNRLPSLTTHSLRHRVSGVPEVKGFARRKILILVLLWRFSNVTGQSPCHFQPIGSFNLPPNSQPSHIAESAECCILQLRVIESANNQIYR